MDKGQLRDQVDKIIIGLGVALMFCTMISGLVFRGITLRGHTYLTSLSFTVPNFRGMIGEFMNFFMSPIVSIVGESNFFLIVSAMAIITAIYSTLIQKYAVDQAPLIEFQGRMKAFQKEMREAQKSQNTYMLKKLEEQQAAIMQEQSSMVKKQFKPMFYIVFVSIPLWMWAYYYIGGHPTASVIFPFWGERALSDTVFWMFTYWVYWYFISSLAFSQVLRKLLNVRAAGM